MYLLQLYHAEKSANNASEEFDRRKETMAELSLKKKECDESVSSKTRDTKKLNTELHKMEQKIQDKVLAVQFSFNSLS